MTTLTEVLIKLEKVEDELKKIVTENLELRAENERLKTQKGSPD